MRRSSSSPARRKPIAVASHCGLQWRPGMRIERQVAVVGGYSVRYKVAGREGKPVILVHGLSGSTRWWAQNVEALAQRHRVFLVDLPGFGAMRRSPLRQGL